MTERPILFSAPMVRAILESRKTQTRRVLRPQPHQDLADTVHYDRATGGAMWASFHGDHGVACPYGLPGDRLWVRETWSWYEWCHQGSYAYVPPAKPTYPPHYVAPDGGRRAVVHRAGRENTAWGMYGEPKWYPSIHMPRSACRLVLEVTGVRVERLQDISIPDAAAEGCYAGGVLERAADGAVKRVAGTSVDAYRALWDSLNAKRGHGWAVNPWVWVVEFRRDQ